MSADSFDLPGIASTVRRHSKLLAAVGILCGVAAGIVYYLSPPWYEARAEVMVRNPKYSDRNNIYSYDGKLIDYFASEEDINRIVSMSASEVVQRKIIDDLGLVQAYHADTMAPGGRKKLIRRVDKNLNVMRTENQNISLAYTDNDPARAADVVNKCIDVLEEMYNGYYKEMRMNLSQTVAEKIHYEDSMIARLTDSLVALRQQYGIYEIISPSRHNMVMGDNGKQHTAQYARGLEEVQNVESIKDEMVTDRAACVTLVNQYASGQKKQQLPMIKVITPASAPISRKGVHISLLLLSSAFAGSLFCLILILLAEGISAAKTIDNQNSLV